jgi:hypothetical protein
MVIDVIRAQEENSGIAMSSSPSVRFATYSDHFLTAGACMMFSKELLLWGQE